MRTSKWGLEEDDDDEADVDDGFEEPGEESNDYLDHESISRYKITQTDNQAYYNTSSDIKQYIEEQIYTFLKILYFEPLILN